MGKEILKTHKAEKNWLLSECICMRLQTPGKAREGESQGNLTEGRMPSYHILMNIEVNISLYLSY